MQQTPQELEPYDLEGKAEREATAETKLRTAAQNRKADIEWIMGQKSGRRFVYQLLGRTGLRKEPMTGNSHTFYNLGAMAIGRELEAELFAHSPEQYMLMITENSHE